MKNLLCIIGGFILGIIATIFVCRVFIMPGVVEDFGVLGMNTAMRAYEYGYVDGLSAIDNYEYWFDDETVEWVSNYEYKFIK